MVDWRNNGLRRSLLVLAGLLMVFGLGSGIALGAGDPRGLVYIAPGAYGVSASGNAVKLLKRHHRLKLLRHPKPNQALLPKARGVVLNSEDLDNPALAQLARNAYAAGLTVALVEADAETAERLRQAVGRNYPIALEDGESSGEKYPLIAIREDGATICCQNPQLSRTHILGKQNLTEKASPSARRQINLQEAEWLKAVFNPWPETTRLTAAGVSNDLTELGNATLTDQVQSNSIGAALQLVNHTWSARSFLSNVDYYYVKQGLTLRNPDSNIGWIPFDFIAATNTLSEPAAHPVTVQFSPETTQETTSYTSGVSFNIGGVAGYNKGGIATVNSGLSISNSTTTVVPKTLIFYEGDPRSGVTSWRYQTMANDDDSLAGKTYGYNEGWIWAVPLDAYHDAGTPLKFSTDAAGITVCPPLMGRCHEMEPRVDIHLTSSIPQPFNHLQLAPPTVTSVSTPTAKPGDVITVTGSNFYLIQSVLIGGAQVAPGNYQVVESDSKLNIVIPANQPKGNDQSIVINTDEGLSNNNVTVSIQ